MLDEEFCPRCGAARAVGAAFCGGCGRQWAAEGSGWHTTVEPSVASTWIMRGLILFGLFWLTIPGWVVGCYLVLKWTGVIRGMSRESEIASVWAITAFIVAGLGDRVPILLSYSVTAFPVDTKPARIWGIRFATSLYDANGVTVDLQPTTELLDIVKVGATAQLDIGIGGKIEVPEAAAAAISAVPGVTLNDASIGASDKVGGKVRISFVMSVPKVIAGPDASAGARWFLYAQDRQLNGSQALLQTALVPRGTTSVTCEIIASVAAAGLFGAKEWHFETARHEVSLAGLGG